MSLYSDLGVEPTADEAVIRAAYRKQSKKAHPDGGGSPEAFAQISRARAVLCDPKKRAQYDRDGRIDDPTPDNDDAQAMSVVMQVIFAGLDMIEKRHLDPSSMDLINLARTDIGGQIANSEQQTVKLKDAAAKLRKVAKRFKVKKGQPNRIALAFEARAAEIERGVADQAERTRILKLAYDIAALHSFEVDSELEQLHRHYAQPGGLFISTIGT